MLKHLQQPDSDAQFAGLDARAAVGSVLLRANSALLLVLALIIIPTLSGVSLIV